MIWMKEKHLFFTITKKEAYCNHGISKILRQISASLQNLGADFEL